MEPRDVVVKVTAHYSREGSILQNTARSRCDGVATEVTLRCDDTPEAVARLIRMAEASCYTLGALRDPVDCSLTVSLNGEPLDVGGAPS